MAATVERSAEGEVWSMLGNARLEARDLLIYEDVCVPPGRFAYRLRYVQSGMARASDIVWIDVPSSYALSLEGFRPNPAQSAASIAFSLPDAAPATLQLCDVAGRKIISQQVGSLGPGSHVIQLAPARLGSGMYWLRLIREDRILTAKGIVTR